MSKTLKEMLVGIILGDAHIQRVGLDKAFISFEQSNKKFFYINHVYQLMKEELPLQEDNLKEYERLDNRYGKINRSLYFRTQSIEDLRPLADLFLDSKEIISALAAQRSSSWRLSHISFNVISLLKTGIYKSQRR